MNKRNAAAAAASNGDQEGTSPPTADDATGSGVFSLPSTTASERLRNPFADYDDGDEDDSGSGSDDGEGENVEGGGARSTDNAWNRGSWWRGVVRSARGGGSRRIGHGDTQDAEVERFGDGRDDESSDEEGGRRLADDDDIEDEEFGDFAMPEVEERVSVSGIDPARESILVKPMALHPTTTMLKSSTISPFTSLWPFSRERKEGDAEGSNTSTPTRPVGVGGITEEPVELTREEEAMISEDGKKIDRAVEAKRRTSIEDPDDDDEVDVGEEIAGHRTAGIR
jgi:SIT4-associating protein SAP185/190